MRKFLPHIGLITMTLVGVGFFFVPETAHAAWYDALNPLMWSIDVFYSLLGRILWLIGTVLAWAIYGLGQIIDQATTITLSSAFYDSVAIKTSWSVIRDICNMAFIFVLIWAGMRTILNLGQQGQVKKTITGVIVAALLINFSLFITKAVIDVSNVATAWFVQGIQNVGNNESISLATKSVLKIDKLVSRNPDAKNIGVGLQSFVASIAFIVITLVVIYVFFQVTFFLIARIVTFIFLLITSPVGFIKWLEIPQLNDYSQKWWKELWNQALMAPMFFLMLYITLYLADNINTLVFKASPLNSDPVTGSNFAPANYAMFAIIVMMLLKSLTVAKQYSGEVGGAIAGYLKGATTLVGGAALTRVIGGAGAAISQSKMLGNAAVYGNVFTKNAAKIAMRSGQKVAGMDFGVKEGRSTLGFNKVEFLKDNLKGAEKGFEGDKKAYIKYEQDFGKQLGEIDPKLQRAYGRDLQDKDPRTGKDLPPKGLLGKVLGIPSKAFMAATGQKGIFGKNADTQAGGKIIEDGNKAMAKDSKKKAEAAKRAIYADEEDEMKELLVRIAEATEKTAPGTQKIVENITKLREEQKVFQAHAAKKYDPLSKEVYVDPASGMKLNLNVESSFKKLQEMSARAVKNLEEKIKEEKRKLAESDGLEVTNMRKRVAELQDSIKFKKELNKERMAGLDDIIKEGERVEKAEKDAKVDEVLKKSEESSGGSGEGGETKKEGGGK